MTNFDEYFVDEKLNRQLAVARAKRYSAQCFRKRNRRNYIIAVAVGLILATSYFVWQITRPVEPLVESADTGYTEYTTYTSEVPEPQIHEPVVSADLAPIGEFEITAYCPCAEVCCGKWGVDRPLDEKGEPIIYTASGAIAEAGVTVAVDPNVIPLGTEICIEGLGVFTAQDTGAFTGNIVDIYFEDHDAAREFGRKTAKVWEVYYHGMSS